MKKSFVVAKPLDGKLLFLKSTNKADSWISDILEAAFFSSEELAEEAAKIVMDKRLVLIIMTVLYQ